MNPVQIDSPVQAVRDSALELMGEPSDYDALMDLIGDAKFVLLGEASHGTHEFYAARAMITQRLIEEKQFAAVAVEADWPDAWRVDRFVRGRGGDDSAAASLSDFTRFPTWMWRNADVLEFLGWLREYNSDLGIDARVAFLGLDIYNLYASIAAVIEHLDHVDGEAAARARKRYACFDHWDHLKHRAEDYGHAAALGLRPSCEREASEQWLELRLMTPDPAGGVGLIAECEHFNAERNACAVRSGEAYYRSMFSGQANTWNLRDQHMAYTLRAISRHLGRHGGSDRVVVWAHNSHIGNAAATEVSARHELNLGQLMRESDGDNVRLIGFTTYHGSVTAASSWGSPAERLAVRPALRGSVEDIFHQTGMRRFFLPLKQDNPARRAMADDRLERMIGVIYRPHTERSSHYVHCALPRQFDAVLHFDATRAVEPIDRTSQWEAGVPETFPFGL